MLSQRAVWPRNAGRLLVVAAVLVSLALTLGPAPARAATLPPPDYYGANVQPIFEKGFVPPSDWNGLIAAMGADSLDVARMDAAWSWVEPKAPVDGVHTYDWNPAGDPTESMDDLVSLLASNDVRMLAVLALPPSWAGGDGEQMLPAYYGDFVAYAAAFAARYGPNGTFWKLNPKLPYLPVEQFEIGGEANSTNFWTGSPDPAAYVQVLEPLHAAVHAVDPGAQVLASIGWENFSGYVSELYQDGVKGSIDGIGFHPYAPDVPSTIGLVQQMRATLVASGDPELPIYDTELGEPAAPNSPADATRAAMESLIGDALAHSDCSTQSFDIYALTGSDTSLEPISEGYMGILDDTTFAPNITGQALIAASRRWQADPAGGLVLCGAGSPSSASLLPLGLSLTHTTPTCVSATISYYGNPLQSAQIILRTADGRVDPAGTNTAGQTQMCLQNGPAITSFTVYAEISSPVTTASFVSPNIAQSATYTCIVSTTSTPPCTLTTPAPNGGITTTTTTTTSTTTASAPAGATTTTTATTSTTTQDTTTQSGPTGSTTTRTTTTQAAPTGASTTTTTRTTATATTTQTGPGGVTTQGTTTITSTQAGTGAPTGGTSSSTTDTDTQASSSASAASAGSPGGGSGATGSGGVGGSGALVVKVAGAGWLKGCGLRLELVRIGRRRTTFRARLLCRAAKQPNARLRLTLVRRGKRNAALQVSVGLSGGRWRSFSVKAIPRVGDRITASVAADKAVRVPAVHATLTATPTLLRAAKRLRP